MDIYFGCLKGGSKSVQVLVSGTEAAMELILIILKWRALSKPGGIAGGMWPSACRTGGKLVVWIELEASRHGV